MKKPPSILECREQRMEADSHVQSLIANLQQQLADIVRESVSVEALFFLYNVFSNSKKNKVANK